MARAAGAVIWAVVLGCAGGPSGTEPAPDASPPPAAAPSLAVTPPVLAPAAVWSGTQTFSAPWTELGQVATLPSGGAIVGGSRFTYAPDGSGARHGTLAWVDATGAVVRMLEVPGADEIFAMAVSPSGAIGLGGYTQGEGGYLAVLDSAGSLAWRVSMGPAVTRGVTFASDGDLVACGWDDGAFVERRARDGALRWRTQVALDADGFSFGVAISPSGEIAAAGGRATTAVARLAPNGALRWTWSLPLGSDSSSVGGVAIDGDGSVVVAGRTSLPPPGVSAGGSEDAFVARLDPAGALAWVRSVATADLDVGTAVVLDASGAAIVAGARGMDSSGNGRGFVARWDRDGAAAWTTELDLPGNDVPVAIALDVAGDAWVVGAYPADPFGFGKTGFLAKVGRAGGVL